MSKTTIGVLLGVVVALLLFGFASMIPGGTDIRPVPTDTPSSAETTPGEDGEGPGGDDVAAGQAIYEAQCASCHTTDGSTLVGPSWQGLFGSEVTLEDGSTVTADEEYIRTAILEPNAQVSEGFQPIMPAFDLSDEEIDQIIAFMQTLE